VAGFGQAADDPIAYDDPQSGADENARRRRRDGPITTASKQYSIARAIGSVSKRHSRQKITPSHRNCSPTVPVGPCALDTPGPVLTKELHAAAESTVKAPVTFHLRATFKSVLGALSTTPLNGRVICRNGKTHDHSVTATTFLVTQIRKKPLSDVIQTRDQLRETVGLSASVKVRTRQVLKLRRSIQSQRVFSERRPG